MKAAVLAYYNVEIRRWWLKRTTSSGSATAHGIPQNAPDHKTRPIMLKLLTLKIVLLLNSPPSLILRTAGL